MTLTHEIAEHPYGQAKFSSGRIALQFSGKKKYNCNNYLQSKNQIQFEAS